MVRSTKLTFRSALLLLLLPMIAACGGNSSNTAIINTSNPSIFYAHTVAFRNSTTFAWGYNGNGQLGNGTAENASVPVVSTLDTGAPMVGMTGVVAGGNHSLAFKNLSGVRAWGNNALGQLGNGTTNATSRAVVVALSTGGPLTGVTSVAAGAHHSLALRSDGTVWAWGYNGTGQLGDTTTTGRSSAVPVSGLASIVSIAAGGTHSLACDSNGNVWSWGNNVNGQLGLGTTVNALSPQPVPIALVSGAGNQIIAVAAGGSTSLALDKLGNVYAWGYNAFGQLGTAPSGVANTSFNSSPVKVSGLPAGTGAAKITKIAVGLDHCLALYSNNQNSQVWAWGYNGYGQLGRGSVESVPNATPHEVPELVSGITGTVIDISAAGHTSYAVTSTGTDVKRGKVWAWGHNAYGQAGNGTTSTTVNGMTVTGSSTPAIVKGYEQVP